MAGYLSAVISAILYGLIPLFSIGILSNGGTPLTIVTLRFLLIIPFIFLIASFKKISLKVSQTELKRIFFLSQAYMATSCLLSFSYQYIPAGMSTCIHFIYPTLVLFIYIFAFHEPISLRKLFCALLGLLGVYSFYTPGETASAFGMLLAFLSAWTFASYIVYDEKSGIIHQNPYTVCFYLSIFCGLETGFLALIKNEMTFFLPWQAWIMALFLALGSTLLPIVLVQISIRYIGAEKTSFLSTFEPLTSVLSGILFLQETITPRTIIGIFCILISAGSLAIIKHPTA